MDLFGFHIPDEHKSTATKSVIISLYRNELQMAVPVNVIAHSGTDLINLDDFDTILEGDNTNDNGVYPHGLLVWNHKKRDNTKNGSYDEKSC